MVAITPTATANGRAYRRISSNFTRPNDTTAYAVGDLVADSVTAGSVTPFSWATAGSRPFDIPVFRLHKTGATGAIDFRIYVFSTSPTVSTTGDNGAFASNVNNAANCMVVYEGTVHGFKDGAAGLLVPFSGVIKKEYIGDPATLYGLLEVRTIYTPIAQEVFTATPIFEFDA